jgi:translin
MLTLLAALPCSSASARYRLRQEPFLWKSVEDRVAGETITSSITEEIVRRFERLAATRDRALGEGRQITRLAANSVRATHRGQIDEAERLLAEARERMMTLAGELQPYPSIYWAGYVQDAMKEAAEAAITLAIVANRPLPEPAELGAEDAAYLNAMAEAASELRRQVLDRLRENDLPRAEYLLGTMDDIYSALVTVDFPDAITGGLRRTTDALRAVLERTRGDVTMAATQGRVERALREALGSEFGLGMASPPDDAAEPSPVG